jgi:hypothetical protein
MNVNVQTAVFALRIANKLNLQQIGAEDPADIEAPVNRCP